MGQTIDDVLFPDRHKSTALRTLGKLATNKLIWQTYLPVRGGTPFIYGLTDDGRQMLNAFGVESDGDTFDHLIWRSKQAPVAPVSSILEHETYISDWCASLLDHVRRTPMLAGVHIQRQYRVKDREGTVLQTIGAVIILAFDPAKKAFERPIWSIPWLTDTTFPDSWRVVRLALEVDTGMTMRALVELALRYRACSDDGSHKRLLGDRLRPVIIASGGDSTSGGDRTRMIASWWMDAWPGSLTLLSSRARTAHPDYGVLWGEYRALETNPVKKIPLLGPLLGTVDTWPNRIKAWPGSTSGSNGSAVTTTKPTS
jgi:hypothetical protein